MPSESSNPTASAAISDSVYVTDDRSPASAAGQVRWRGIRQVCGEPDVAIVEADQLQAVIDKRMTKLVRPRNGLRGDAHDQQHDRRIAIPEALVGNVDAGWPDLRRLLVCDRSIEPIH